MDYIGNTIVYGSKSTGYDECLKWALRVLRKNKICYWTPKNKSLKSKIWYFLDTNYRRQEYVYSSGLMRGIVEYPSAKESERGTAKFSRTGIVPNLADQTEDLRKLTKGNGECTWNEKSDRTSQSLKKCMGNPAQVKTLKSINVQNKTNESIDVEVKKKHSMCRFWSQNQSVLKMFKSITDKSSILKSKIISLLYHYY